MKGRKSAATPAAYIASLDEPRRSEVKALDALIRKHAPKLKPVISGGMLGYGPFHYVYPSGREGDACRLSVASNAASMSLYVLATNARGYLAEQHAERLGPKVKVGKSCVRIKKLADVELAALAALIREASTTGYGI
jgi:hypothetical protein